MVTCQPFAESPRPFANRRWKQHSKRWFLKGKTCDSSCDIDYQGIIPVAWTWLKIDYLLLEFMPLVSSSNANLLTNPKKYKSPTNLCLQQISGTELFNWLRQFLSKDGRRPARGTSKGLDQQTIAQPLAVPLTARLRKKRGKPVYSGKLFAESHWGLEETKWIGSEMGILFKPSIPWWH